MDAHTGRIALVSMLALAIAVVTAPAAVALEAAGLEFQVNSYTYSAQVRPAVAAGHGFVVVWRSDGQDGDVYGVFGRRFTTTGEALAAEFQVSSFTTSFQYRPAVAMDDEGDFVVAWQSFGQDGFSNGIFAQRFASSGATLAGEFQVNSATVNDERYAAIAMAGDGDFVVAWTSFLGDASSDAVIARRFDSAGSALDAEFLVNAFTAQTQSFPAIGMADDDRFTIVWESFNQDAFDFGVFARRFTSAGAVLGDEFQVSTFTLGPQRRPAIAMDDGGAFVVAWNSGHDGDPGGVFARRFDSSGAALGGELLVNARTASDQRDATIAIGASGDFVIAWTSFLEDGSSDAVVARRFDSSGAPQASAFQVNSFTDSTQSLAAVAASGTGEFVIAWNSFGQDGEGYGVFAQRFTGLAVLDIDGDGTVAPLTDGVLALRFLFLFDGSTLTTGAFGNGCTRCTAGPIKAYLTGLGLVLDVDGNNSLGALTDGLLLLRYLLGFSDTALTAGATGSGCTRCDAGDIGDYLQPLI